MARQASKQRPAGYLDIMNSSQASGSNAALVRLAENGASSAQIAEALLDAWRRMDDALAPIVGPRGVAALFLRALHVTAKEHPWLPSAPGSSEMDLGGLHAALCARPSADTATAGDALLRNFTSLLSSLVGHSLADHLVGPLRPEPPSGDAAQDT